MNSAYISALAALAGSGIGALATIVTTWLNQAYQNKIQRHADERTRRERLFGEFINEAARAYSDAMANRLEDPSKVVNLYAIKSRIALFSNDDILKEADNVLHVIMTRYFSEKIVYAEMDISSTEHFNLLGEFTRLCRDEMIKY